MYRTSIARSIRPLVSTTRQLSTSIRVMSAGDTGSGASRAGGERSGDAFTRRETAAEELYIREQEKLKLHELKAKLGQQRKHLDELENYINDLTKNQGGEQN